MLALERHVAFAGKVKNEQSNKPRQVNKSAQREESLCEYNTQPENPFGHFSEMD
jgi:hypothetical protein